MTLLCYYCSTEITLKRRRIAHINVCQRPSIIYFCNQDCKLNWIFKKSDLKIRRDIGDDWIKDEANSDPETVKTAPHTTIVKRLDAVKAARELNLKFDFTSL